MHTSGLGKLETSEIKSTRRCVDEAANALIKKYGSAVGGCHNHDDQRPSAKYHGVAHVEAALCTFSPYEF